MYWELFCKSSSSVNTFQSQHGNRQCISSTYTQLSAIQPVTLLKHTNDAVRVDVIRRYKHEKAPAGYDSVMVALNVGTRVTNAIHFLRKWTVTIVTEINAICLRCDHTWIIIRAIMQTISNSWKPLIWFIAESVRVDWRKADGHPHTI